MGYIPIPGEGRAGQGPATCQFRLGPGMKFKVYLAELVNSEMALTNMLTVSSTPLYVYLYVPAGVLASLCSVCVCFRGVWGLTP